MLVKAGILAKCSATSIPFVFMRLVRQGRITVRVYGGNWRDVVILQGPHTGKTTLSPPRGRKPYLVIDPAERERRDKAVTA